MLRLNDFEVFDLTLKHIDDIVEIEKLSFKTPWTKEAFISELTRNKCAKYRAVFSNEKVVGYGGMWIMIDEAHVTNIAIHPEFRGIGLGNLIMEDLLNVARNNGARSMTLEVRTGNLTALNLYKKFGFLEVARRKGYYQDTGEDAIIMWKYNI